MRLFVPSLTYLPCYRPCPHPHTPGPTEQALSEYETDTQSPAHKDTHTGPAIMAASLAATPLVGVGDRQMPSRPFCSPEWCQCWGKGLGLRLLRVRGPQRSSLMNPRCGLLPLFSCNPYLWRPPSAASCRRTWLLFFLSQVYVVEEMLPTSPRWGDILNCWKWNSTAEVNEIRDCREQRPGFVYPRRV